MNIININIHFFSFYLFSFLGGIGILLSFIGWGSILKIIVFPKRQIDWAQRASWGVAFSIFIGGILNLFNAVSAAILISYLGIGVFSFFSFNSSEIKSYLTDISKNTSSLWQKDKAAFWGIFIVLMLLLARYAASVIIAELHTDDLHGYLAFAQKMLQTGSLQTDPFSARRINSLGGHSFLQVLVFSFLKIKNLYIIDGGIAYIIAIGLLWNLAKEKKVSRPVTILILSLFLLVVYPYRISSNSHTMSLVLFLALFLTFERKSNVPLNQRLAYIFIAALLISAIGASKNVYAGFIIIYVGIIYLVRLVIYPRKKETLLEFLILLSLSLLFILPWIICLHQSLSRISYLSIGKIYLPVSTYRYIDFPLLMLNNGLTIAHSQLTQIPVLFLIALSIVSLFKNHDSEGAIRNICICISAIIAIVATNVFSGQYKTRYLFSFVSACLVYATLFVLSGKSLPQTKTARKIIFGLIALLIPCLLISPLGKQIVLYLNNTLINSYRNIDKAVLQKRGLSRYYKKDDAAIYRKAQYAIPAGEVILSRLRDPYLLNFKRNKIFIVDQLIPGPSPGMPIFSTADAISEYLVSQKIKYVIYFYRGEERDNEEKAMRYHLEHNPDTSAKPYALFGLKLHNALDKLGITRKRIYDDGNIFVIDLSEKVSR